MFKTHHILFWASGLALGLMVCAVFSCPHWQVATPVMAGLSGFTGFIGYKQRNDQADA